MLLEYAWPGNVRELNHCLERACLAAGKSDLLLPAHLPTRMRVDSVRRRMRQGLVEPERANEMLPATDVAPAANGAAGLTLSAGADSTPPSLREWKSQAEKSYVRQVWDLSGEDVRKAAEVAGISRGHWYELMKKIGL
jgi:two-component system NtrC family response regulator